MSGGVSESRSGGATNGNSEKSCHGVEIDFEGLCCLAERQDATLMKLEKDNSLLERTAVPVWENGSGADGVDAHFVKKLLQLPRFGENKTQEAFEFGAGEDRTFKSIFRSNTVPRLVKLINGECLCFDM